MNTSILNKINLVKLGPWVNRLNYITIVIIIFSLSQNSYALVINKYGNYVANSFTDDRFLSLNKSKGKIKSVLFKKQNVSLLESIEGNLIISKIEIQYPTAKAKAIVIQQGNRIKSVGMFLLNNGFSFSNRVIENCEFSKLTDSLSKLKKFNSELIGRDFHKSCDSIDEEKIDEIFKVIQKEYSNDSIYLNCISDKNALSEMQSEVAKISNENIGNKALEEFLLQVLGNYSKTYEGGHGKIKIACDTDDNVTAGVESNTGPSAMLDTSKNDDNFDLIRLRFKDGNLVSRDNKYQNEKKEVECADGQQDIFHELLHTKNNDHNNSIFKIVENTCYNHFLKRKCGINKTHKFIQNSGMSLLSTVDQVNRTQQQADIRADREVTAQLISEISPSNDVITNADLSGLEAATDSKKYNDSVEIVSNKMEAHANALFGLMNRAIANTPTSDYSNDNYKKPNPPKNKIEEITTEEFLANENGLSLNQYRNLYKTANTGTPTSFNEQPVVRGVVNTKLIANTAPSVNGGPPKMNSQQARNILGLTTSQFSKDPRLPASISGDSASGSAFDSSTNRQDKNKIDRSSVAAQFVSESKVQVLKAFTSFKGGSREELLYMLKYPEFLDALRASEIQIMDKNNKVYGYIGNKPKKRFVDNGAFLLAQGVR